VRTGRVPLVAAEDVVTVKLLAVGVVAGLLANATDWLPAASTFMIEKVYVVPEFNTGVVYVMAVAASVVEEPVLHVTKTPVRSVSPGFTHVTTTVPPVVPPAIPGVAVTEVAIVGGVVSPV